jgi:hypothetical protein
MSILRFFTILTVVSNFILGALGLFGYIWRPAFRAGTSSAPYFLVRLYSWLTPRVIAVMLGLWLLFWMLAFVTSFASKGGEKLFNSLLSALRIGLVIAVISGIPSLLVKHSHIDAQAYNSGNYNFLRENSFGKTSLLLVYCTDPGQLSCRTIERADIPLPLESPPMPTRVVEVQGVEVILAPNYIPTATPPVEFGIEAASGDLAVRVGQTWNILATPEIPPEAVVTPAPSE